MFSLLLAIPLSYSLLHSAIIKKIIDFSERCISSPLANNPLANFAIDCSTILGDALKEHSKSASNIQAHVTAAKEFAASAKIYQEQAHQAAEDAILAAERASSNMMGSNQPLKEHVQQWAKDSISTLVADVESHRDFTAAVAKEVRDSCQAIKDTAQETKRFKECLDHMAEAYTSPKQDPTSIMKWAIDSIADSRKATEKNCATATKNKVAADHTYALKGDAESSIIEREKSISDTFDHVSSAASQRLHCHPPNATWPVELTPEEPLQLKNSDIICGPFQLCYQQPGNKILNQVVVEKKPGYKALGQFKSRAKGEYISKIISDIEKSGRRFLIIEGNRAGGKLLPAPEDVKRDSVKRRLQRNGESNSKSAPDSIDRQPQKKQKQQCQQKQNK